MQHHKDQFAEKIIEIKRTSKKTKGGNAIAFSALCVVGDKKGKVGVALGKAPDVASAIRKGMKRARKQMITVSIRNKTIPHYIEVKEGAARILLKPAPEGTGVRAGGPVRAVVETAGIQNIVSKILGTRNKLSNVYATMKALRKLRS